MMVFSRNKRQSRRRSGAMKFEKILSLGHACDAAHQIRRHFHQTEAYPFDWLTTPLSGLMQLIENDFALFLDEGHLTPAGKYLCETKYGVRFLHEFPDPNRFRENLDEVRAKYQRRIQRWWSVMESGGRLLFVRSEQFVNAANVTEEKARALLKVLQQKYLKIKVHLLVLNPVAASIPVINEDNLWLLPLKPPEPWEWSGDDAAWSEVFERVTGIACRRDGDQLSSG